jgi:hypothetical protein
MLIQVSTQHIKSRYTRLNRLGHVGNGYARLGMIRTG